MGEGAGIGRMGSGTTCNCSRGAAKHHTGCSHQPCCSNRPRACSNHHPRAPRTCANIIWPGLTATMGLPGSIMKEPAAAAALPLCPAEPGRPRTGVEGSLPSAPEAATICRAVGL